MIAAGFVGLFATIASGPVAAIAVSVALVGGGIGTCWAHVGSIVLGSARQGEEAMTASLIPTTQAFAVSMGAALSGIIANAAGLSGGDSRPAAALAAAWLSMANKCQLREFAGHFASQIDGVVGRAVIDHHDFELGGEIGKQIEQVMHLRR